MAPQQPTPLPSSASAAQIVTVTVFSTSPSASTLPASSGKGGANVPIAAIAGGAAGGVTLAVILVLIWNYWGLVIKRTEKRRRKEAQDILTVRENTRRNATSRINPPQSGAPRPTSLTLNPESRKVKFLTRKPTWSRGKDDKRNSDATTPAAIPQMEEMRVVYGEALTTEDSGTDAGAWARQPSPSSTRPLLEPGLDSEFERQKSSESTERQPEEEAWSPWLELAAPSPSPRPSQSPTPSHAASDDTPPPRPPRSPRRRTVALPDPSDAPPIPIRSTPTPTPPTLPSASTPNKSRTSRSPSRLSKVAKPHHASETPTMPPASTSPVPTVHHAPVAGPSTTPSPPRIPPSAFSRTRSPLRDSVLPSDRPVVMPRAKNAHATSQSQSPSPSSIWAHGPPLSSPASYVSTASGEPLIPREHSASLRYGRPTATAGAHQLSISIDSIPSAYSTD